ncbi:hypothetical protein RchiOBHm_Chr0c39g0503131 [Rosa chinensis]|uniref:Uncharacterized protein n=1 Tax=Rosa chinensis TaxID=74649 RepID=A0A2P6SQ22_ROSCH|nr:hypothetical protein RchiOBHm_Chr0c39g0503131 [Rosa chinensis]
MISNVRVNEMLLLLQCSYSLLIALFDCFSIPPIHLKLLICSSLGHFVDFVLFFLSSIFNLPNCE